MGLLNIRKCTVFLIEHEIPQLQVLRDLLKGSGFTNVVTLVNAQSAILELKRSKPDLVILECNLPDIPGIHLLRALRSGNQKLPVVMIAGEDNERSAQEVQDAGANGFFKIPVPNKEFVQKLDSLLLTKMGISTPTLGVRED